MFGDHVIIHKGETVKAFPCGRCNRKPIYTANCSYEDAVNHITLYNLNGAHIYKEVGYAKPQPPKIVGSVWE